MTDLAALGTLAGGLGLFLLGMTMMTDGLKLAAGAALARVLAGATRTRWHGLGSGVLVTALVQSSSAVTVATIGFVNAGLLGLGGALWVLFGANVGTTMTGWIVALVGLKFKVEALALPLIGFGVVLRLAAEGRRAGALGTALAGFGLLFLGIAMLQQAFGGLAERLSLPEGTGAGAVLAQMAAGVALTVLMQSSSAAMTVTLTAAQGGLIDPQGAAAVVIGANVGTTVTALLAVIGATANARRAAAAHVAFNVLTGAVALALLPWLLGAIERGAAALELPDDPAARLALFHTCFNLLGVVLMLPLAAPLTRWLDARFRSQADDAARPRHLDDTVLAVPALAVDALRAECARIGAMARAQLAAAVAGAAPDLVAHDAARALLAAADGFVQRMNRGEMGEATATRLASLLQALRAHEATLALAASASALKAAGGPVTPGAASLEAVLRAALAALDADTAAGAPDDDAAAVEAAYADWKRGTLAAGAAGALPLADMDRALRAASALRRGVEQARAARRAERAAAGG